MRFIALPGVMAWALQAVSCSFHSWLAGGWGVIVRFLTAKRSKSVKRFQVREEGLGAGVPRTSSSSTIRRHYEETLESTTLDRVPSNRSPASWIERYEVSSNFRKSWSGHLKHSVTTSDCASRSDEDVSRAASGSLHGTTSLDSITSRQAADKIVFKDTDDSSDDEIISPYEPTPTSLPEVPQTYFDKNTSKVCVCVFTESHKRCQNLPMQSFLLLPMQTITRLPLLVLAIINRTLSTHPEYDLVDLPYDLP